MRDAVDDVVGARCRRPGRSSGSEPREPGGIGLRHRVGARASGAHRARVAVGGRPTRTPSFMTPRPAHRAADRDRPATAARAGVRLHGAGRVRIDYRLDATGDRHAAARPRGDGPPGPGGGRRRHGRGRDAAALARPGGAVRGRGAARSPRFEDALAGVRLRAEPRLGLLGPPDGHRPDGRGPGRPPVRSRGAGSGRTPGGSVVPRALRRRRLAVPDRRSASTR